jgi:hypothetical protein
MPNLPNEDREKRVVATGPNQGFTVRGVTGFFTDANKLDYGVNVQGNRCGVYGESGIKDSRREATQRTENVGVCGVALTYGVFGKGFTTAGVHGEIEGGGAGVAGESEGGTGIGVLGIHKVENKNSKLTDNGSGIIGVTEGDEGFGVVGLSVDTLNRPGPSGVPRPFRDEDGNLLNSGDGSGTGVLGGSGSGVGVLGRSGLGIGVEGHSDLGTGVDGNSAFGTGVEGHSDSGIGVVGRSIAGAGAFFTSLSNDAVVGRSGGPGDGVRGRADSGIGVRGEAVTGFGVFGDSEKQSGVVGRSRSTSAPGVFGICEDLTGVAGRSTSAPGVFGESTKQAGVMGRSASSVGVFGFGDAPFKVPGPPSGVLGVNDKSVGVIGSSAAVIGVLGNTDKGLGVVGTANSGAGVPTDQITDQGIGVIGLANSGFGVAGMSTSGTGVFGSSKTGLAGHFKGPVTIEGNVTIIGGTKSAAVPHPDGSHRQLYCMESPESWFEDFGEAQLVNGKGEVRLDPDFAALVEVNGYHVFLTPYGESKGMFVAERHTTGFRVCEQQGGTSTVSFAYRVVAKRKDVVTNRLATVTLPDISSEPQLPDLRLKISSPDFDRLSVSPFDLPGSGTC